MQQTLSRAAVADLVQGEKEMGLLFILYCSAVAYHKHHVLSLRAVTWNNTGGKMYNAIARLGSGSLTM